MPPRGRAQEEASDAGAIDAAAGGARADASFGVSAADQQEPRKGSASIGQSLAPPLPDGGQQAPSHLPSSPPLARLPSHETGLQREHVGGHRVQLRQASATARGAVSTALVAAGAPIFLVVATERRSNVAQAAGSSAGAASPERGAS